MGYLSLSNVGKEYKTGSVSVNALSEVTFELNDGEFVVILGSSGAGKTTLLNLFGGMDKATSGEIILDGKNVTSLDKRGNTAAAMWVSFSSSIILCQISLRWKTWK